MNLRTFINGLAYGFILGILFAPSSGEETRRRIAKRASDIKDSVKDKYEDFASTVKDRYDGVKTKFNDMKHDGEEAFENATTGTSNHFE